MHTCAIIVAAGSASRMQYCDKQALMIGGKTVLARCLEQFESSPDIQSIVLVTRQGQKEAVMERFSYIEKLYAVVEGGKSRQLSVCAGVLAVPKETDLFAIHDGARPFVDQEIIHEAVEAAKNNGAAAAAIPVKDTIKEADSQRLILHTPDRSHLFACQTPQVFSAHYYRQALDNAIRRGKEYTDDCQLLEAAGFPVILTQGKEQNFKITTWQDVEVAKAMLESASPVVRVGHGYDVHALSKNRKLTLCGVEVPFEKGLIGHSDADVAVHALIDGLLGAAGLGDIGRHFPDSDPKYAGINSLLLLDQIVEILQSQGWKIGNADLTIVAQRPKLSPYLPRMLANISEHLRVSQEQVNVKATTEEHLGFTGKEEGISSFAVCVLQK